MCLLCKYTTLELHKSKRLRDCFFLFRTKEQKNGSTESRFYIAGTSMRLAPAKFIRKKYCLYFIIRPRYKVSENKGSVKFGIRKTLNPSTGSETISTVLPINGFHLCISHLAPILTVNYSLSPSKYNSPFHISTLLPMLILEYIFFVPILCLTYKLRNLFHQLDAERL